MFWDRKIKQTNPYHRKASEVGDVKFWKLCGRGPISKWHKNRLLLIGDAAHPMLTCKRHLNNAPCIQVDHVIVQGQGGGQAIEDGAALGVLFSGLEDPADLEKRLQLFENVRRNRGSAIQILSSTNPPASQAIRDAASKYLPEGKKLDTTDDINDYIFSFDVLKESSEALAAALSAP